MKKEKYIQKNDYSRGYIEIHPDINGELYVMQNSSDGSGVRMGTWKLDHLVHLAKIYDQEKFGEKFDENIKDINHALRFQLDRIVALETLAKRTPRFGWKK